MADDESLLAGGSAEPGLPTEPDGLEGALEALGREAQRAVKSMEAAIKEARRVKSAAASGNMQDLQKSMDSVVRLAEQGVGAANSLRESWTFDVPGWFSSGEYTRELMRQAGAAELRASELDGRVLSYPALLDVSAKDCSVQIDKRLERRVRPTVLVGRLLALQKRPANFNPKPFIASLARAYDLLVGAGGLRLGVAVKLVDVHKVLTLLPPSRLPSSPGYSVQEFARDLYLLDQSGVTETTDGRRMTLPRSAMSRGSGVLRTVSQAGQIILYVGIAFSEAGT